ncbi:MAG: tRNA threonylcarbamoyladenosine biosynthesis protein TsaB [Chthoniobacterales bacterium]
MKTLAIDLSSSTGSIAVAENGAITAGKTFAFERGRGADVFAALAELRELWRGADLIAVGIGPGSYNGLRTACALANSMQMATGAKLRAAPSPCLLAVDDAHYVAYGDARGGRAYRAEVRDRKICGEISLLSYAEAAARSEKEKASSYRTGPVPDLERLPEAFPDAGVLAVLAQDLPPLSPAELGPIYLKPPHITLPRPART